ncbi:MAG TPA: hypothetical protein VH331_08350 [Allosphingosinicella sp.]|jgi:hypothetical protein|nr:hypothetical protein [Allosphingosinicella sp.]
MKHAQGAYLAPGLADAGGEVARLRQVLQLVQEIAGAAPAPADAALDQSARIGAAYERALPIDQRRFDEHAADTARWAAAGLQALLQIEEQGRPCRAAARVVAERLGRALGELERIVRA